MTRARLRTVAVVLPLAAAVLVPAAAHAAPATSGLRLAGTGTQVPLLATTGTTATVVADEPGAARAAVTATINVTYHGFSPAAKASFERAVATWERNVVSKVPINIDATYQALGPGVLGSAGSNKIWQNDSTKTLIVDALANKKAGRQLDPSPDIIANFSSSFDNWYFGTGDAPQNTYDFQSVVTHEIGHGLGFLGAGDVANGKGTVSYSGYAFAYAKYTENGAGKKLTSFVPGSTALGTALTSNQVYFDSPAVAGAASSGRVKLYAPRTWSPGSSFSHLDERAFPAGDRNSLMTPQLADGETVRIPGPVMKAVFQTIGW